MHLIKLCEDLQKVLEEVFKDKNFERKTGLASPRVDTGWYTTKRRNEDLPYILISPATDTATLEEDTVRIFFVCEVFNEGQNGWKDASLIAGEIKRFLKSNWKIGDTFAIDNTSKPIVISYPDEQPYPQWRCVVEAYFNILNPQNTSWEVDTWGTDLGGKNGN